MRRPLLLGIALCTLLAAVTPVEAQVFVRAPFVRVQVGPGVAVRAPFFRLFIPPSDPAPFYYPPVYVPPVPLQGAAQFPSLPDQPLPPAQEEPALPLPNVMPDDLKPPVAQPAAVMTLEQFAKAFQPQAGSYEIELLNPVTNQPTRVRFTLPEGQPKLVNVHRREIEFVYGPRQFVRIEFDRDGALVTSR